MKKQAVKKTAKAKPRKKPTGKGKPLVLSELDRRQLLADLEWKEERVKLQKLKRQKLEGELISKKDFAENIVRLVLDIRGEVMPAIEGIAKGKSAAVDKIFRKYLN